MFSCRIFRPLSGLAVLVCLKQEQYERGLKLVDVALSEKRHIAIERIAYEGLITAKAEALDGIGDESSIFMLHQLLHSNHFDSEMWKFLLLMVSKFYSSFIFCILFSNSIKITLSALLSTLISITFVHNECLLINPLKKDLFL